MAGQDRQPGIPLAAPRPAHLADGFQRPGGHAVAQAPGPGGQRCGAGHDGHVLPGADARPAGAPESAGPARHSPAAAGDLPQGRFQFQLPARVFVGGQQRRAHHHMVFRAVHMAERQVHHPPEDGDRVRGGLGETQAENAVHTLGMAIAAYIVPVDAAGFTGLLLVADGALHHLVLHQIFQRCFADQTFFFAHVSVSSQFRSTASCSGVWNQCSPPSITVSPALCCRAYISTIGRGVKLSSLP